MAGKTRKADTMPDLKEIETEMSQVRSKGRFRQALRGTFGTFIVVAALAVIIAFIFLPVLRITNGHNMEPGLQPGDIVILQKTDDVKIGDVCAFYFNNKLLLRRVIAREGDKTGSSWKKTSTFRSMPWVSVILISRSVCRRDSSS